MKDPIKDAFLRAVDITKVEKLVVDAIINDIDKKIGKKAIKPLLEKWEKGEIDLRVLLRILEISIDKLRLLVQETGYIPIGVFDKLLERDLAIVESQKQSGPYLTITELHGLYTTSTITSGNPTYSTQLIAEKLTVDKKETIKRITLGSVEL